MHCVLLVCANGDIMLSVYFALFCLFCKLHARACADWSSSAGYLSACMLWCSKHSLGDFDSQCRVILCVYPVWNLLCVSPSSFCLFLVWVTHAAAVQSVKRWARYTWTARSTVALKWTEIPSFSFTQGCCNFFGPFHSHSFFLVKEFLCAWEVVFPWV